MFELLFFLIRLPFVLLGAALSVIFGVLGAILSVIGGILTGLWTIVVTAAVLLVIYWLVVKVFGDSRTASVRG